MTKPRSQQISLSATPYYHCVSCCVRKAYLCGKNYDESKDYEHRRGWIEERLFALSHIFTIDIVSYAVMSNHYHVILAVDKDKNRDLTDKEVVKRWHRLFNGSSLTQDFANGIKILPKLQSDLKTTIDEWRDRLNNISWFMRCMNEAIARMANKEDKCTGRFWEGRFKSQALLDDKALIACMAYVDLNPIRANMAQSLAESEYTSIKHRLEVAAKPKTKVPERVLMPFEDEVSYKNSDKKHKVIPSSFLDYIELVEWTGSQYRQGKKGTITKKIAHLLINVGISQKNWTYLTKHFEEKLKTVVGSDDKLNSAYTNFSIKRIAGKFYCRKYLGG